VPLAGLLQECSKDFRGARSKGRSHGKTSPHLHRTADDPRAAKRYIRRAALLHSLQMANAIALDD